MRVLVACDRCQRQYDAGNRPVGSKLHCSCGETLTVGPPKAHTAAVVRCSACDAPRSAEEETCAYCGPSFTLRERDLNTICPHCMARVGGSARFCHHCATPIVPEDYVEADSERSCPACCEEHRLISRQLGDSRLPVLECARCAGLWLGGEVFRRLEEHAKTHSLPAPGPSGAASRTVALTRQEGPLYRPCPVCGKLMHRQNYGKRSGVVIDSCKNHGLWFDDQELARILTWIRDGGLESSLRRDEEDRVARQRIDDLGGPSREVEWVPPERASRSRGDFLTDLAGLLLYFLRH